MSADCETVLRRPLPPPPLSYQSGNSLGLFSGKAHEKLNALVSNVLSPTSTLPLHSYMTGDAPAGHETSYSRIHNPHIVYDSTSKQPDDTQSTQLDDTPKGFKTRCYDRLIIHYFDSGQPRDLSNTQFFNASKAFRTPGSTATVTTPGASDMSLTSYYYLSTSPEDVQWDEYREAWLNLHFDYELEFAHPKNFTKEQEY